MKKYLYIFFIILCLSCFVGCTRQEDTGKKDVFSDSTTSMASWRKNDIDIQEMLSPILMGDVLYYWNGFWNRETMRWSNTCIYKKKAGDEAVNKIATLDDKELIYFLVDSSHNLYYLYAEYVGDEKEFFFGKETADGEVVYNKSVSAPEEDLQRFRDINQNGYVSQGEVNGRGEVCLCSPAGDLFLFDGEGQFLCSGKEEWETDAYLTNRRGLVNAGEKGIYSYLLVENKVMLKEVNMSDASFGMTMEVILDTKDSLDIYSGYDRGILISDSSTLWEYALSEKRLTEILDLGDDKVNLNGYEISQIGIPDYGGVYILVHLSSDSETAVVYINTMLKSKIPEKQVIVLGMMEDNYDEEDSDLEVMAKEFNRYNQIYQIEIKYYSSTDELTMDLLNKRGPDAFELGAAEGYVLTKKGVMEDLSPYFKESGVVNEDDLLPAIRTAGYVDGKFVFMFPKFTVSGFLVEKGTTENGGWTPEEFVSFGEKYPDSRLLIFTDPQHILRNTILADMESFINWKDMECYFNSDRFIALLEGISNISDIDQEVNVKAMQKQNIYQLLHNKELLADRFYIGFVSDYLEYRDAYGGFIEFAGFPNVDGKAYYRIESNYILGMNSASILKDGVWAFMEYLLSYDYQSKISMSFPVRKDAFEVCLNAEDLEKRAQRKSESGYTNYISGEWSDSYPIITDDDREFIKYMISNAYWNDSLDGIIVSKIISEETGAFFSGDKSAKEVADIIQNRVSLYLKE